VFGTLERCSPEMAAFANGVAIRYLDVNDATGSGGGHPSDAFAALFALADSHGSDGKTFITAAVIAYELFLGFYAGMRIRNRGWDHVVYTALAAAGGATKIMKLESGAVVRMRSLSRWCQIWHWRSCGAGTCRCGRAMPALTLVAMPCSHRCSLPRG